MKVTVQKIGTPFSAEFKQGNLYLNPTTDTVFLATQDLVTHDPEDSVSGVIIFSNMAAVGLHCKIFVQSYIPFTGHITLNQ